MLRQLSIVSVISLAMAGFLARAAAQPVSGTGARSRVIVHLPSGARLYVEGKECPLKSENRAFSTGLLEPGKKYEYTLRAEIDVEDDSGKQTIGVVRDVRIEAGKTTEVRFGDENSFRAAGGFVTTQ